MKKHRIFSLFLTLFTLIALSVQAETPISLFNSAGTNSNVSLQRITALVHTAVPVNAYRRVKVQVIRNIQGQANHLLLYLFSKTTHHFSITRINITPDYHFIGVQPHYALLADDIAQQPDSTKHPMCPNSATELLVVSPNDIPAEITSAKDVIAAGKLAQLTTKKLLRDKATRKRILDYLRCPNLIGFFYVGDGNMNLISTSDGVITTDDLKKYLTHKFQYQVTTILSSADGFRDPMKTTMTDIVQAQKFIASNDPLYIGFADKTASCTMVSIIENPSRNIQTAFQGCAQAYGSPQDAWGIAGDGSDFFGRK